MQRGIDTTHNRPQRVLRPSSVLRQSVWNLHRRLVWKRVFRWVQIQFHHTLQLLGNLRIPRNLESPDPVRLQSVRVPRSSYRRGVTPATFRHGTGNATINSVNYDAFH